MMLRHSTCLLRLKRKKSPFVHKFLEGCPVPSTLVDDLAGANLRSTTPFFATTPRYIVETEKRLSKMFFHHSLYPAGGARRPYRVVVVRGGRGVQNQSVGFSSSAAANAAAAAGGGGSGGNDDDDDDDDGCRQKFHRLHRDPARRPFFYSKSASAAPSPDPSAWTSHGPPSIEGGVNSVARPVEDGLLAPLCGVIEGHFADIKRQRRAAAAAAAAGDESQGGITGASKTIGEALAALLSGGHGGVVMAASEARLGSSCSLGEAVMEKLLSGAFSFPSSFFYVHAHLPSSALFLRETVVGNVATTSEAQPRPEGASTRAVVQLAGGFVPSVHFAVGSPQVVRCSATRNASVEGGNVALTVLPFGHIQCLLRVRTRGCKKSRGQGNTNPHGSSQSADVPGASTIGSRRNVHGILEPWKLGVSLDPVVPFYMRTITERCPTSSAASSSSSNSNNNNNNNTSADAEAPTNHEGASLLGRDDCETYLLPQRELLFTFYTPSEVVAMCAEQNEERLRRQAALGYSSSSHAFAEGPRTARRILQGKYCNHTAAEGVAVGNSTAGEDVRERQSNSTLYEVRALPGDAIFVPRGWKYRVERIIGTAVMHAAATITSSPSQHAASHGGRASRDLPYGALKTAFMHAATVPESMRSGGQLRAAAAAEEEEEEEAQNATCGKAEVVGVDVDAFVLCYKPYPILSAAQAATYVSANYVHGGIDEFYANGGNDVFHKYK